MKRKILVIILLGIMAISLYGCNKVKETANIDNVAKKADNEKAQDVIKMIDTFFTAFENTVSADNYEQVFLWHDWDEEFIGVSEYMKEFEEYILKSDITKEEYENLTKYTIHGSSGIVEEFGEYFLRNEIDYIFLPVKCWDTSTLYDQLIKDAKDEIRRRFDYFRVSYVQKYTDGTDVLIGMGGSLFKNQGIIENVSYNKKGYLTYEYMFDNIFTYKEYSGRYDLEDEYFDEIGYIHNCFKSKDMGEIWNSLLITESSEAFQSYRVFKQGITNLVKAYSDEDSTINFVKDIKITKDECNIQVYAKDYYLWCEDTISTFVNPSNVKEEFLSLADFDEVVLELNFKLDGKYISDFSIYHGVMLSGEAHKDGIEVSFWNVNKLNKDTSDSYKIVEKFINEIRPGDNKYAILNKIKEIRDKSDAEHLAFKVEENEDEEGVLTLYVLQDENVGVYNYDGHVYEKTGTIKPDLGFIDADILLDHIENGTPLPKVPEWKQAYIDYINKNNFDDYRFSLVCIDSDDVPELLVYMGEYRVSRKQIYTYYNNSIQEFLQDEVWNDLLENGMISEVGIVDKAGVLVIYDGSIGFWSIAYYKVQDRTLQLLYYYYDDAKSTGYEEHVEKMEELKSRYGDVKTTYLDASNSIDIRSIIVDY